MTLVALFQLVLAVVISVVAAVTDHKSGKVRNKHLAISLTLWLFIIAIGLLTHQPLFASPRIWISNFIFSCAATLILYLNDIWAPGDAKLFLLLTVIYPDGCYAAREGNLFPLLDIIVFSFAIGYLYLEINTLCNKKNNAGHELGISDILKARVKGIVNNLGIALVLVNLLIVYFDSIYEDNLVLCILIIGLALVLAQRRIPQIYSVLGIAGWIFYIILMVASGKSIRTVFLSAVQSLIIGFVVEVLNIQISNHSYREINGDDVEPGMILSVVSSLAMTKCNDPNIPGPSTETRRSRLNVKQAEAVRQWCRKSKSKVVVVEMLPFAPFISLALAVEIVRFFVFYYV